MQDLETFQDNVSLLDNILFAGPRVYKDHLGVASVFQTRITVTKSYESFKL